MQGWGERPQTTSSTALIWWLPSPNTSSDLISKVCDKSSFSFGLHINVRLVDRRYRDAQCKLTLVQAEGFARENKFREAGLKFAEAMSKLVGGQLKVPLDPANGGGVRSPVYMNFTMDECLNAMTCCNGAALNLYESEDLVKVSQNRHVDPFVANPRPL